MPPAVHEREEGLFLSFLRPCVDSGGGGVAADGSPRGFQEEVSMVRTAFSQVDGYGPGDPSTLPYRDRVGCGLVGRPMEESRPGMPAVRVEIRDDASREEVCALLASLYQSVARSYSWPMFMKMSS